LWGLYYALFLLLEKYAFSRFLPISTESIQNMKDMSCRKKAVIWFYKLVTLFIVLVGWVLFRVENISDLLDVLGTMFLFKAGDLSLYVAEHAASCSKLFYVIPGIIVAGSLPSYIIEKMRRSVSPNAFFALKAAVALVLFVISVLFLIASSYNPFIYFRF
jgi:alginate O-acetyltransferase complex protein AlgI